MPSLEPSGVVAGERFSPASLSGLALWVKADVGAGTVDGAAVNPWTDQSPGGHSLTLKAGDTAPTWAQTGTHGLPVVRCGAINRRGLESTLNLTAPYTVAVVLADTLGDLNTRRALQGANNWLIGVDSGKLSHYAVGWVSQVVTAVTGVFYTCVATNDGSASRFYVDGTDRTTSTAPVTAPGIFCLSGSNAAGQPVQAFGGDVAEVIAVTRVLATAERLSLEAYLKSRWGTA